MIKLPFGLAILNPEEYFDFVNGNLSREQGRREGMAEVRGNYIRAFESLERENMKLQRLVSYKDGYAKSLERVTERYRQILRKATVIRLELQDALADLLKHVASPSSVGGTPRELYWMLLDKSPLNEEPPPQFIEKKEE